MEPPRIENNFSPSFLCPISAFSAFSARDSLTPRWAEHVKSGLLLRRPLSSDSQLQRLLRGIFPGQQWTFVGTTRPAFLVYPGSNAGTPGVRWGHRAQPIS